MNKIINKILLLFLVFLFFSCNEFQKLLRNEDVKIKYEMAEKYYENEEWRRASTLFEQIQPKYRGKPQGERITFFYANSLLNKKNFGGSKPCQISIMQPNCKNIPIASI